MDAQLTAALIGAIVATVGSAVFIYVHEEIRERRDRGRVASALLVEVIAQAEFIVALSNVAHKEDIVSVRETYAKFVPARPVMFTTLAGQLPILGARTSSCLISCYGSVEWARSLVDALPPTVDFANVKRGPHNATSMPEYLSAEYALNLSERQSVGTLHRLRHACRASAFNAVLSIRDLDRLASHKRLPNDETIIADTIRKLEAAAVFANSEDKAA